MNISDYLIEQSGKDWADLLSEWRDLLPESFTVWLVNRFGDVFLVTEDGSVHVLDVGVGALERVADSRDHFADQIGMDDNAANWLLIPLVDDCVAAGLIPSENQCYSYKVPPVLGGEYALENIEPADLSVHYCVLASLLRQTKDLDDGTRIQEVVLESPPESAPGSSSTPR